MRWRWPQGFDAYGCDLYDTQYAYTLDRDPTAAALHEQARPRRISTPYRLPFEDSSIDVIISDQVFEHVLNYPEAIDELSRVMRGGVLILWLQRCRFSLDRFGYDSVLSLLEFVARRGTLERDMHEAEREIITKAAQIVTKAARNAIGHEVVCSIPILRCLPTRHYYSSTAGNAPCPCIMRKNHILKFFLPYFLISHPA